MTADRENGLRADLDRSIARLLTIGNYISIALLAIGVLLLLVYGIRPLSGGPPFKLDLIADDLVHLRPAGFMWLGLLAVLATPSLRVVASLIGFIRLGERTMAIIAVAILAVIALSVALAQGLEG